jgi:hypothetical protein
VADARSEPPERNSSRDEPGDRPGDALNPDWVTEIQAAQASDIKILGYVDTKYGTIDISKVEAQIDSYNQWYNVDGIFFDQVAGDAAHLSYYQELVTYVASIKGNDVVLNEGVYPDQSFAEGLHAKGNTEITHVAFEGSYDSYLNQTVPIWAESSKTTFADLVYDVPSAADMQKVVQLASDRDSSYVYATPDVLPNQWDMLASNDDGTVSYWPDLVRAV